MSDADGRQTESDLSQLKILSYLWYAWGALFFLGGCGTGAFGLLGGSIGAIDPNDPQVQDSAMALASLFGCVALTIFIWGALNVWAGASLAGQRNRTLITVISVVNLVNFPIGTGLAVFTLITVARPSVQALFALRRE